MIHAFTSSAANYIPKVRILAYSMKRHHPEIKFHLALSDKKPDWLNIDEEPFDSVISIDELDIPNKESWIFRHTVVELCTAVKPFVFCKLMEDPSVDQLYYFDPDMALFSRLDDMIERLEDSNCVLTPHQTIPERTLQNVIDNEICSLKHGIYNLGFLGLRNTHEGRRIAQWWADRCYEFCRADIPNGLFTDQRWMDLVPAFFDGVTILKSPRFNVAPWNVTTRKVEGGIEQGFTSNGRPLGFYHFTGFDSGDHALMVRVNGGDAPALLELVEWYTRETESTLDEVADKTRWAFARYASGDLITKAHRRVYLDRKDLQVAFPHPFDDTKSDKSYHHWFQWRAAEEYPEEANDSAQELARATSAQKKIA